MVKGARDRKIEVTSSSDEDIARSEVERRKTRRKTKPTNSSEQSLSTNEEINDELDFGSRLNLIEGKEPGKRNTIIEMESVGSNENSDIDVRDEESLRINKPVESTAIQLESDDKQPFFKQPRGSFKSTSKSSRRLNRLEKTVPTDIEMSTLNSETQRPIDVVVDIHYENEEGRSAFHEVSGEDRSSIGKEAKGSAKGVQMKGMFTSRNVESNGKRQKSLTNQGRKNVIDNNVTRQDSFDLIEEFNQTSDSSRSTTSERANKERARFVNADWSKESSESGRSAAVKMGNLESERLVKGAPMKIEEQKSGDGRRRTRRKWSSAVNESSLIELKKSQRKRWSKDAIVPFSETGNEHSWSVDPVERQSLDPDFKGPIPAPRSKASSKRAETKRSSFLEYDNAAFQSDQEDVLTIETDHRESTKIELRKLARQSNDSDSKLSDKSVGKIAGMTDSLSNLNLSETTDESETRITAGDLNERKSFVREENIKDIVLRAESSEESKGREEEVLSSTIEKRSRLSRIHRKRQLLSEKDLVNDVKTSRKIHEEDSELIFSEDDRSSVGTIIRRSTRSSVEGVRMIYSRKGSNRDSIISASESGEKSRSRRRRVADETTKKRRKTGKTGKRKSKRNLKSEESSLIQDEDLIEEQTRLEEKYISITVHRSEMLETDYITKHPMVKVHIVEASTGNYLKTEGNDHVGGKCKYLQPMITGKFDFREKKSVLPTWEEELIFEHDFESILRTGSEQVLILFEIVDLLSFAEASQSYSQFGSDGCWYKIAWAFVKPVGVNGMMHVDKTIRLQLYRPTKYSKKVDRHKCEVYSWWKSNCREKYPSSLFVTVTWVEPPKLEPVFYGQLSLNDLSDRSTQHDYQRASVRASESIQLPKWTRLSAQSCKIPNESLFETETSERGHFYVAFSNNGKYLACVGAEENDYSIIVYTIEEKKIHVRFSGHRNFVYSLDWSNDDYYLLSVSSDQTACLWDVHNKIVQCVQLLPHPSYVYCGKFDPENNLIVATGCFDHAARIWARNKRSKDYQLVQELEIHEGFVNSLGFQKDGSLLTADSVGIIVLWTVKKNRKIPAGKEWQVSRKIKIREIENAIINTIVLHPLGSRLLVHSRNNGLRMLDLATGVVLQRYEGLKNQRVQITARISPCGGLVLCGGEDSSLNVWNLENGTRLARYTINRNTTTVTCVDYHPYDHVLAFSVFGISAAVKVLKFDKNSTGDIIGLKLLGEAENEVYSTNEVAMNFEDERSNETLNLSRGSRSRLLESSSSSRGKQDRRPSHDRCVSVDRGRRSTSRRSTDVIFEDERNDEERRNDLKTRLQKMSELEQNLKVKSTNRLISIIEKIDRILSSTTRCDQELVVQSPSVFCERNEEERVLSDVDDHSKRATKRRTKFWKYSKLTENSTTSNSESVRTESFEMRNISGKENQLRSRSAKGTRALRIVDRDLLRTFSDSAVKLDNDLDLFEDSLESSALKRIDAERKFDDGPKLQQSRSSRSSDSATGDNRNPRDIKNEVNIYQACTTSDSEGTYVVEKSELEKNNDLDFGKTVESDNSIRSNVTFIIENELPVPKPRRKVTKRT